MLSTVTICSCSFDVKFFRSELSYIVSAMTLSKHIVWKKQDDSGDSTFGFRWNFCAEAEYCHMVMFSPLKKLDEESGYSFAKDTYISPSWNDRRFYNINLMKRICLIYALRIICYPLKASRSLSRSWTQSLLTKTFWSY